MDHQHQAGTIEQHRRGPAGRFQLHLDAPGRAQQGLGLAAVGMAPAHGARWHPTDDEYPPRGEWQRVEIERGQQPPRILMAGHLQQFDMGAPPGVMAQGVFHG